MCCILNSLIIEGNHKHSQTKVDIISSYRSNKCGKESYVNRCKCT